MTGEGSGRWLDESRAKQRFVDRKLAPLLVAMGVGVAGCDYAMAEDGEYVHVAFDSGFRRRVNVTGDSLKAFVQAVL